MTIRLLLFIFCALPVTPVSADMWGAGDMKIIAELKAMYQTMIKTLSQAKTQNEQLNTVKTTLNDFIETRQYVQNFDADRIARRIHNDLEGITQMDDLNGMNTQQRIRAVQKMLRKRVADPATPEEQKKRYESELRMLEDIEIRNEVLELANANATKNMVESSKDLSLRDSGRITAESLAALSQLETQREIAANNDRIKQIRDQQSLYLLNQQNRKLLKNAQEEGW